LMRLYEGVGVVKSAVFMLLTVLGPISDLAVSRLFETAGERHLKWAK
jgi:hypothetical protein